MASQRVALRLDDIDVEALEPVIDRNALTLESVLGGHAMAETAASCAPVCSCCITCCCCCCG